MSKTVSIAVGIGSRFYDVLAILSLSAGVNVLTSSTVAENGWLARLAGLLFASAGAILFYLAGSIEAYYQDAYRKYREKSDLEKMTPRQIAIDMAIATQQDHRYIVSSLFFSTSLLALALWLITWQR